MKKYPNQNNPPRPSAPAHPRLLLAACLALLLPACSRITTTDGPRLPPNPPFTLHTTTLADILQTLGPPAQISATPAGSVLLYEHNRVVETQLGFSIPYQKLKYFKFVYATATLDHNAWIMTFDAQGTLLGWGQEHAREPYGTGFAMQFLFVSDELVDTSALFQPAPQHHWALAQLQPLPKSLNLPQSLTTGTHGLQQSTSPTHIGQQSLEMPPKD